MSARRIFIYRNRTSSKPEPRSYRIQRSDALVDARSKAMLLIGSVLIFETLFQMFRLWAMTGD